MPFDPTKPAFGSPDSSAEMRAQLNGLKDIIDAIPAGPPGPQGPPFASAVVDGVSTLNPGDAATVGVNFDGTNVHFSFGLPRGADGSNGTNGTNGSDGAPGAPGEVTAAQLAAAIAGTSANSNGIPTLDTPFADPDAETLRAAYNALVLSLRN